MDNEGIGFWPAKRRLKSRDAVAIAFEGNELTYGAFADRIDRLANALRDRGIGTGDRVAYLGENHPSFLETMFATAVLGAIFVPVNTRLAAAEVSYILGDSGARFLVVSATLAGLADAAGVRAGRAVVGATSGRDADDAGGFEDFEQLVASGSDAQIEEGVELGDAAMILYTSGTTGRPKGALLTHENLTWNAFNVLVDYDLVSTDRALMVSPLFHVASLGMGALPSILKGATVILERKFDPERVLTLIEQHRITWMSGVPTTFQLLCESPSWATADLSSLEKLTCGGSPVPLRVIEAYASRGLAFTGGYGMTETAPGATSLSPAASRDKVGSSGLPHFFTEVRIVGADDAGVGEIEVRGRNVIPRYWNRVEDTAAAFAEGRWFRTGDLGSFDEDGYLTISDRLKDMIISGGENIYPAEVELVIAELEAISGAAVIGVPDERWGEVPLAVVTVRAGFELGEAEVLAHLAGRIAKYKTPKRVIAVAELPRTASGKVQKALLRARYAEQIQELK